MVKAIEEARISSSLGQYALAAVIVGPDGKIVSVARTTLHGSNDPTAHAEVNAIREACQARHDRFLVGCWLYTTLEPCPMCAAAAIWAKMEGIVFGATEDDALDFAKRTPERKFTWRQINVPSRDIIDQAEPKLQLVEGFMRDECNQLFEFGEHVT